MESSASTRTWIVLADSTRARIYLVDPELTHSTLLRELDHPESRVMERDLVTGDRGRGKPDSPDDGRRSAMEPSSSPKAVEAEVFARHLAQQLEHSRLQNAFESLIIAAPPQFLGTLRDAMTGALKNTVRADLPKHLLHLGHHELLPRIQELLVERAGG